MMKLAKECQIAEWMHASVKCDRQPCEIVDTTVNGSNVRLTFCKNDAEWVKWWDIRDRLNWAEERIRALEKARKKSS